MAPNPEMGEPWLDEQKFDQADTVIGRCWLPQPRGNYRNLGVFGRCEINLVYSGVVRLELDSTEMVACIDETKHWLADL